MPMSFLGNRPHAFPTGPLGSRVRLSKSGTEAMTGPVLMRGFVVGTRIWWVVLTIIGVGIYLSRMDCD